jgi:hypothetical protein
MTLLPVLNYGQNTRVSLRPTVETPKSFGKESKESETRVDWLPGPEPKDLHAEEKKVRAGVEPPRRDGHVSA